MGWQRTYRKAGAVVAERVALHGIVGTLAVAFFSAIPCATGADGPNVAPNAPPRLPPQPGPVPVPVVPPVPETKDIAALRAKLITRGKLEDWLKDHGFSPSAERAYWKNEKPEPGTVSDLIKLTGVQFEVFPCGPAGPYEDPSSCYSSPDCTVWTRYTLLAPTPDGIRARELNSVEVNLRAENLTTPETLIMPSTLAGLDGVRAVLAVQGFTTTDQKRYVLARVAWSEAERIAASLGCFHPREINLAEPPNDPVFIYDWKIFRENTGIRIQGLSRADWKAKRKEAEVQLEVFLEFAGPEAFPLEPVYSQPLTVERVRAMLKIAGCVEQPAGIFTHENWNNELSLLVPRLGLTKFGNTTTENGWQISEAANPVLDLRLRDLNWSSNRKPPDPERWNVYIFSIGKAPWPPVPPARRPKAAAQP